jgi:hypothetical protein
MSMIAIIEAQVLPYKSKESGGALLGLDKAYNAEPFAIVMIGGNAETTLGLDLAYAAQPITFFVV